MNDADDERIHAQARQLLDEDAAGLDASVVAQLGAARQSAMTALRSRRRLESMLGWAAAAGVVLALNIWWWQPQLPPGVSAEDFEVIVSGEQMELYEDLDFYGWVGDDNDAS